MMIIKEYVGIFGYNRSNLMFDGLEDGRDMMYNI
jgi:hypothetical protein